MLAVFGLGWVELIAISILVFGCLTMLGIVYLKVALTNGKAG